MTETLADHSPNLALPYLWPAQAQKHVTHNEALTRLDALSQIVLAGLALTTPPDAPDIGSLWSVGPSATGAWDGQDNQLALWDGTGWQFLAPKAGWIAWDQSASRLCRHDGTAWQPYTPAHLAGLGIGTAPDVHNRLAVAAPATLLTHEGEGHQLKINKAATAETASLLFQSDWEGHAEIGLTGSDDLTIKVSADGSTWRAALQIAAATGEVTLGGPVTGPAITQSPHDQTAGRLLKTGDGGILGPVAQNDADLDAINFGFIGNSLDACPPENAPLSGDALWAGWQAGNAAGAVQYLAQADGTGQFTRKRIDTTWGPWCQIYDQNSAVGHVAYTSGVNSGAVLESAGDADGGYLRLACGTQICWGKLVLTAHEITTAKGVLFQSANALSLNFSQAFHAAPHLCTSLSAVTGHAAIWPQAADVTTTGASLRLLASPAQTAALTLVYHAIGRWRA